MYNISLFKNEYLSLPLTPDIATKTWCCERVMGSLNLILVASYSLNPLRLNN